MKKWLSTGILLALLGLSVRGNTREIQMPLSLDNEFLRQILISQVYTGPNRTAQMWGGHNECNSLVLSNPQIDSATDQQLRITSEGTAKIGTAIGDRCIPLFDWKGIVEVFEKPMLGPRATAIYFKIVKSNIYNTEGEKNLITGKLWDQVKEYVHPKLSQVRVDLHPLLAEIQNLLPSIVSRQERTRIQAAVSSLALTKAQTTDTGIKVTLRFELPDLTSPQTLKVPEPILSAKELQEVRQHWDAFLTFVIKHAAAESHLEELRLALLEILLDTRYDIEKALTSPTLGIQDPVRVLFRRTWERLSPILRRLSLGMTNEVAMRYLSFIAAGDALKIIDQLGSAVGLDISTDGLRRLARMLAPQEGEGQDPLFYSLEVDPSLRQLFGFGPPLSPSPQRNINLSFFSHWLWRDAWATDGVDPALIAQLNRWVPTLKDINTYLPLVHRLLNHTAENSLHKRQLKPKFQSIYRWLLLATAWQESCWRQFIKQGGVIKPLRSNSGSVGLMQINQNVWRGFYNVNQLSQNIAYNAKAGGEILMHYFVDYAIKKGEYKKTGNIHNLARAAYAAYNGGPSHLHRYRKKNISKSLHKIDTLFWKKYQAIKEGNELAVAQCFGAEISDLQP